ncbi:YqiA/YcfP family alpha/beta fold hydrolase [Pseudomonas sp. N040]|uniref:YqiA/YcfP family alpha/beta fold hydrolase n=1 Tax=Pseudomonas sp. N040 TaxID=2785325 RepID=UPI0018A2BD93|nr:YqiA/YcfP family alpha/beta fold hydrolase [Pseudomonas sp. N040]MBF7730201.1 esterase [Pseudomonas sp. N040]MBW7013843.1 esterase [Pseudomonas sp. N040]
MIKILYIHGLNSSPASTKAQQLLHAMHRMGIAERLYLPALHHQPRLAVEQLEAIIAGAGQPVLVGSSLGGYYATFLAHRHGLKALLINPSVRPHLCFDGCHEWQTNYYTGERWLPTEEHLQALAALEVPAPQDPQRCQVWLQTADQTLDYREAEHYYRACALRIQAGGDHGFAGFAERLPALFAFAGLEHSLWRDTDFSH